MDNKCSNDLKQALNKADITLQLVPPHLHQRNKAEQAIQTFKNHFKAILATIDPAFPLREWDRLLVQGELTLNLLRTSTINPKLSAYAYIFGQFDYNKTPLVPPGTKIVAHNKPSNRASWELNEEQGWYIGPSLEHYRCIKCYFTKTQSERDCNTVTFFPKQIQFPKIDLDAFLCQAAQDIITLLTDSPSCTTLSLQAGDPTQNALLEIATILKRTEALPTTTSITPPHHTTEFPLQNISEPSPVSPQHHTVPLPRVLITPPETMTESFPRVMEELNKKHGV